MTADHDPTVANAWMMLLYELVRDETVDAPAASRMYAYAGIALYEAVVPGMPINFSIGGQIEGLQLLPFPEEDAPYDYPSAANASLATVITALFQEAEADSSTFERINALREAQTQLRLQTVNAEIVNRSLVYGDAVGAALMEWVNADNYAATRDLPYELPGDAPGLWVPTSEGMQPLQPFWGDLRPFGMEFGEQCNVPLRLEFSTDPESTFYKQAAEVLETSDRLTEEQAEVGLFWIDTPGITGAPAGHWVMIEIQLVEQLELDLARAAEMYVLVGMALGDSFISAWNLKYQVNLVRPVTYIRQNLRRNWTPYLESPPFPEYPSGHSVVSGAAAEVLTAMFGPVAFVDRTPIINGHQSFQRSFTSFEAAAYEAAISRLYGGIHYRAAIENGLRQGQCVGQQVLQNVRLRSVPQGE
ncbi:MAG: hypothetical protein OHK0046_45270 [Anaerolineae bacterium]